MRKFLKSATFLVVCMMLYYFSVKILKLPKNVGLITNVFSINVGYNTELILTIFIKLLIILLFYIIFSKTDIGLIQRCKVKKITLPQVINIILLAVVSTVIIQFVSDLFMPYSDKFKSFYESVVNAGKLPVELGIRVFLIPLFTQVIFTGITFNHLRKNYGTIAAILINTLVYSSIQGNVSQTIYGFVAGLEFAIVYLYTDSILGTILLHSVVNIISIIVSPKVFGSDTLTQSVYIIIAVLCFVLSIGRMIKEYTKKSEIKI